MSAYELTFYALAAGSVISGVMLIVSKSSVYSALWLVLNFLTLAALYAFLNAHLLAVLQLIVYAGAIMVLFLFVVMLIQVRTEGKEIDRLTLQGPMAIVFSGFVLGMTTYFLYSARESLGRAVSKPYEQFGSIEETGKLLFTKYLLPFEMTSVILLVGLVGAVVLAKRTKAEGARESQ